MSKVKIQQTGTRVPLVALQQRYTAVSVVHDGEGASSGVAVLDISGYTDEELEQLAFAQDTYDGRELSELPAVLVIMFNDVHSAQLFLLAVEEACQNLGRDAKQVLAEKHHDRSLN